MARTAQGTALTVWHRQRQLALRAAIVKNVARAFPMWDPKDPATYQAFEAAMVLLTRSGSQQSAALAANYYTLFRGVEAPEAAPLAAIDLAGPPPVEQIRASLRATAQAGIFNAFGSGKSYAEAMSTGLVQTSGAVSRLALNGGRDTILDGVANDDGALGWARVTGGEPCAFCAMLASRGPVYRHETSNFRSHDHCSCSAEPVYRGSEWPGRAREFHEMWRQTGSLNSFREALGTR